MLIDENFPFDLPGLNYLPTCPAYDNEYCFFVLNTSKHQTPNILLRISKVHLFWELCSSEAQTYVGASAVVYIKKLFYNYQVTYHCKIVLEGVDCKSIVPMTIFPN